MSHTASCQGLLTLWAGFQAVRRIREARQGAVHFEHVADGDDALGSVGALAKRIESAELVVVQTERQGLSKTQAPSAAIDSMGEGMEQRT